MGSRVRELLSLCQPNSFTRETGYNQKTLDSSSSYQFFRHLTDSRRRFRPSLSLDLTLVCFQLQSWGLVKYIRGNRDLAVKRALFPQNRFDRAPKILSKKSGDLSNPDCENCAVKNCPMVQKYTFPVHVRENQNAIIFTVKRIYKRHLYLVFLVQLISMITHDQLR